MPKPVSPDRLDGVASSGSARAACQAATPAELEQALARALVTGGLRRIPRNPQHRDLVLAVVCLTLQRRRPYPEPVLNEHLRARLATLKATVDHVTCRRYLVDLGFLKRDRAGSRYFLNYPRLASTLSEEAAAALDSILQRLLDRGGRHAEGLVSVRRGDV
ncbi:MAG: DUF2087 domain-containing protein [Pseudomonadales bacterium]